jgi:hypothetical protein
VTAHVNLSLSFDDPLLDDDASGAAHPTGQVIKINPTAVDNHQAAPCFTGGGIPHRSGAGRSKCWVKMRNPEAPAATRIEDATF